jgi:hypothetical protein
MHIIIPTHNEETVFNLLPIILSSKAIDDTIVIYDDFSAPEYIERLKQYPVVIHQHDLAFNFSEHWNYAHSLIPIGHWLIWLASDEIVDITFIPELKQKIHKNPRADLFKLPRINTFYDATTEDFKLPIIEWNNIQGVAYPDYQNRVCLNMPNIKWAGHVHETLVGYKNEHALNGKAFTIIHHRSYQKQNISRQLYDKCK